MLNYVQMHGSISRREAVELCGLSENQAGHLLNSFVQQKEVHLVGQGRSARSKLGKTRKYAVIGPFYQFSPANNLSGQTTATENHGQLKVTGMDIMDQLINRAVVRYFDQQLIIDAELKFRSSLSVAFRRFATEM